MNPSRSINWFEQTTRSLVSQFPETRLYGPYLVERLASLLLERLPCDTSQKILGLLPDQFLPNQIQALSTHANSDEDTSIGYSTFLLRTAFTLGCSDLRESHVNLSSEPELMAFSEQLTDSFLWAIAQELPAEIKSNMMEHLPAELRSRMNLNSAHSDESKVA